MQYLLLLVSAFFFFFMHAPQTFADTTIMQGTAESNTSVTTNIQGSGSVHTHIESTVNGNTKVLDSDKPGTYTLQNSSDGPSTITAEPTTTPTASPTAEIKKSQEHHEITILDAIVLKIKSVFHTFAQNTLAFLHL